MMLYKMILSSEEERLSWHKIEAHEMVRRRNWTAETEKIARRIGIRPEGATAVKKSVWKKAIKEKT